jgi:Type I restriction enzyme R protein N terminus (HSDR_N)
MRYSLHCENCIDLVLFLNGIPVATVELKTDFTQSVGDAIDQYRFDRHPKPKGQAAEPLLAFPSGALVHFALSNREIHMTTRYPTRCQRTQTASRLARRPWPRARCRARRPRATSAPNASETGSALQRDRIARARRRRRRAGRCHDPRNRARRTRSGLRHGVGRRLRFRDCLLYFQAGVGDVMESASCVLLETAADQRAHEPRRGARQGVPVRLALYQSNGHRARRRLPSHCGAWTIDDRIIFGRSNSLWQIPASGGVATQMTALNTEKGEALHAFPSVVVGSSALLFVNVIGAGRGSAQIEVLSDANGVHRRQKVIDAGTSPAHVAHGYLVFLRNGALLARNVPPVSRAIESTIALHHAARA